MKAICLLSFGFMFVFIQEAAAQQEQYTQWNLIRDNNMVDFVSEGFEFKAIQNNFLLLVMSPRALVIQYFLQKNAQLVRCIEFSKAGQPNVPNPPMPSCYLLVKPQPVAQ